MNNKIKKKQADNHREELLNKPLRRLKNKQMMKLVKKKGRLKIKLKKQMITSLPVKINKLQKQKLLKTRTKTLKLKIRDLT